MSVDPWYAAGLHFSCRRCGSCCSGSPGYVWVGPDEVAAIAALLGLEAAGVLAQHARSVWGGVSLREKPDGRCIFFAPGQGCRVYEARPRQCRTWPFWERIVASPVTWEREAAACPGMGAGELFPAARIEALSGGQACRSAP